MSFNSLRTPTGIAVVVSLVVVGLILSVALAIGGSYLLTIHTLNVQKTAAAALAIREKESAIRTSIPLCQALIQLDNAKNGASNASNDPNSYGHRLAKAITNVVNNTHCRKILLEIKDGVPLIKIAEQK